jgi:hypothetical protein
LSSLFGDLIKFGIDAGFAAAEAKLRGDMVRDFSIPRAVEIAAAQGWVSIYRLRQQAGLSNRDAKLTLAMACNKGVLYQGVGGRFYITTSQPILGGRNRQSDMLFGIFYSPYRSSDALSWLCSFQCFRMLLP